MGQKTVLVITKTAQFYSALKRLMEQGDILLSQAQQWDDACLLSEAGPPPMIVLDCPGSGIDGLSICQEIRAQYTGLIGIVAENDDERFHILALDLGADASFSRTTGTSLVAAHIKALLRRFAPSTRPKVLPFGGLTVDANKRDVYVAGQAVNLSSQEFQVIWYLASKPGCVVSRDEIYRDLRNCVYNGYDRSIDVYVSRIRQKIGDLPSSPNYLKTVRGIGYQFVGADHWYNGSENFAATGGEGIALDTMGRYVNMDDSSTITNNTSTSVENDIDDDLTSSTLLPPMET